MPFCSARVDTISATVSSVRHRSNSADSIEMRPASIFEKSRTSSMSVSSDSPDAFSVSAYSRCSRERSVSSSSDVMPSTPFIGVRISWLMLARNSLLATVAASAFDRAASSDSSSSFCSVTSIDAPRMRHGLPSSVSGRPYERCQRAEPSCSTHRRSWLMCSPSSNARWCAAMSSARSDGVSRA